MCGVELWQAACLRAAEGGQLVAGRGSGVAQRPRRRIDLCLGVGSGLYLCAVASEIDRIETSAEKAERS